MRNKIYVKLCVMPNYVNQYTATPFDEKTIKEAIDFYQSGNSLAETAKFIGTTISRIENILDKRGIPCRRKGPRGPRFTREEQREKARLRDKKRQAQERAAKYGLTIEQIAKMQEKQNNACAICLKLFTNIPNIDHDHATGKVRELLCVRCNTGLGLFLEDCSLLEKAIKYLMKHKAE